MIVALAVNSSTGNDDLPATALSVYRTLRQAGATQAG
jgi:hypothetical protein